MKKFYLPLFLLLSAAFVSCGYCNTGAARGFLKVEGQNIITPEGEKFFIKGTNLGNWLNPEGYMFDFRTANSASKIDIMLCEMVGPAFVRNFWQKFKDNYISRADIDFIASTGANTVRFPFHYKLFTDEDYLGLVSNQDGFARTDSLISWCRDAGLYIILDMHDCPGGQTGDNIDDSYGYPWLFECEQSQQQFIDIWVRIAQRYRNEPVILGYDLMNEPIAPYFENMEELNLKLEPLYKRTVEAIRKVDKNHIIIIGGAQWNSNFEPFTAPQYDDNLMYSCHRYGGEPTADAIRSFIDFRDKTNLPMYMGEIGHNTEEWMSAFCRTMEENNIGWTFWPYKKMKASSFVSVPTPENWNLLVDFQAAPRATYQEVRTARPDQATVRKAMEEYLELCKFENCEVQSGYIKSLGLVVSDKIAGGCLVPEPVEGSLSKYQARNDKK